ncbi:MAG: PAS domain-containing protein [Ignavibacteriae bacterium]|nr:MAG: PAS domain-containing protein [Ignavibacteriota bacterium]
MNHPWIKSFPGAIIVCDTQGIILDMNDQAVESFKEDGGRELVGKNLFDCHPEPARSHLAEMLKLQKQNIYSIEKHGIKKLIYQTPWYDNGTYSGFVEISLPIPFVLPHFIRAEEKG